MTDESKSVEQTMNNTQIETAKSIISDIYQAHNEYLESREKLNEMLSVLGNKMVDALTRFNSKQTELKSVMTVTDSRMMSRELGISQEIIKTVLQPAPNKSLLEFSTLLDNTEKEILTRREWEAKQLSDWEKQKVANKYWSSQNSVAGE